MKLVLSGKYLFILLGVLILTTLISSCKKDKFKESPGVCPSILTTNPINGATGILANQSISATFNEKMDPLTLGQECFELSAGNKVLGLLKYNDSLASISFIPSSNLLPNTTYTARIKTSVRDMRGNALQKDYVWMFSTGLHLTPLVLSTIPSNNEMEVVKNQVISATFNHLMDPNSIKDSSFKVSLNGVPILGVVSYADSTAMFTPLNDLLPNTSYTATITTMVKTLNKGNMLNDFSWTFSTKSQLGPNPPILNSVSRFGIMAGVGIANQAGFSVINNMDVGISPGVRSSVSGFPPAIINNGAIYASDDITPPLVGAMLILAKADLMAAYIYARDAILPAPAIVSGDQGGLTLAPGIYKSTSILLIQNGNLTLDAKGDANAVWIFQIGSALTTNGGAGGNVILTNGAQAKNVYWQVSSSATIGDYTIFQGNILALTSITMNSHATINGRILCSNGTILMTSTNTINKP